MADHFEKYDLRLGTRRTFLPPPDNGVLGYLCLYTHAVPAEARTGREVRNSKRLLLPSSWRMKQALSVVANV